MRSVAVLGATGSIGRQALDVIAGSPDLRACALSANRDADGLAAAARAADVPLVALVDSDAAARAARDLDGGTRVLPGEDGVEELIAESGADLVLNAIVGAAGLRATLAAFAAGADVALANKESLVAGGELVLAAAAASGKRLASRRRDGHRDHGLGRPVSRPPPRRAHRRDRGRGAGPPDVEHG